MKRWGDLWLLPAGALIAFVGALCGIGGGLFTVPLLHFLRGLDLKDAVATALVLVLATTVSSTAAEALRESPDLHWGLVGAAVAGVLLGAQLGFHVARRISTARLRLAFALVLFFAGARLLLESGGVEAVDPMRQADWIDAGALAVAFAAGLGGGFLAPLLGVGGGLLMVPALYFGLGPIGFGAARATSLAAGVVGAGRSLWLHARDGRVHVPAVLPIALGALIGGVGGVFVVHQPGVVHLARILLGLALLSVSARFVADLRALGRGSV